MARKIKADQKQSVTEIRELIKKHECWIAQNPEGQHVPMWQQTLDKLKIRHIDRMNEEVHLKCGSDWWESVKLMYPIVTQDDGTFMVISEAANWSEQKTFGPFSHKYDAIEKIEKLVFYKNNDRNRGVGCRDRDLEKVAPLQQLMTQSLHA